MIHHLRSWAVLAGLALGVAAAGCAEVDPEEEDEQDTALEDAELQASALSNGAVTHEASFSFPRGGKADDALEAQLIRMIGMAPKGSIVRFSVYDLTRQKVVEALRLAVKNGVTVRAILNGGPKSEIDSEDLTSEESVVGALSRAIGKGNLTLCKRGRGACIGDGINHNKFFLFSSLSDGSTDVVVQSSANLTAGKMHNNMVVVRNDTALYRGYLAYFKDLRAQKKDLSYGARAKGAKTLAAFSPQAKGDVVRAALGNVRCDKTSTIRVAMAFFTEARGAVANDLVDLKKKGCDVRVVMREGGARLSDASIVRTLKKGGVAVGEFPAATGNNIHSKYVLVDAPWKGEDGQVSRRKFVFTGSHNFTAPALRANDETFLRIADDAVFAAYRQNWEQIERETK